MTGKNLRPAEWWRHKWGPSSVSWSDTLPSGYKRCQWLADFIYRSADVSSLLLTHLCWLVDMNLSWWHVVITTAAGCTFETEISFIIWWYFRDRLHLKLSFRQLSVQPVNKISSRWHFCFSDHCPFDVPWNMSRVHVPRNWDDKM